MERLELAFKKEKDSRLQFSEENSSMGVKTNCEFVLQTYGKQGIETKLQNYFRLGQSMVWYAYSIQKGILNSLEMNRAS